MSLPRVSIFCFCKNDSKGIRYAIDSLLAQTYPNVEIIVQDGASTDGTLEILQSYGDKIQLISEKDSGAEEAFLKVFRRCTGDYIGSCLADEELLPHAAEQSVRYLEEHRDIAVVHGDILLINANREIYHEALSDDFNVDKFMWGWSPPNFSSAFFRRSALEAVGLWTREWSMECMEYELWSLLGLDYKIQYIPGSISKYGTSGTQLSKRPEKLFAAFRKRLEVIKKMYREHPKLPKDPETVKKCMISNGMCYIGFFNQLCGKDSLFARRIQSYIQKL